MGRRWDGLKFKAKATEASITMISSATQPDSSTTLDYSKGLERRLQEAEEQSKKMSEFIDTLCHELRNPANGIYGNVRLMEMQIAALEKMVRSSDEHALDRSSLVSIIAELKDATSSIDSCVKQQKNLLDDVLHVSKLESGKVILREIECDLKEIIQEVTHMFSANITQKNFQFSTVLPKEEIRVKADPDRLIQILSNLLSNAIKFTPQDGKIIIHLKLIAQKGDEMELEFGVEDTGIGMTTEEQGKLFNRFIQVGSGQSRENGGSGLGLLICKNLVSLMQGNIHIESEKSKGTKVCFTIKCMAVKLNSQPKVSAKHESSESTTSTSSSPKSAFNILIVEDNLINQRLLVKLLERGGHQCTVANNGKEAVEIVSQNFNSDRLPFDAILMDIEMPVMNGLEAAAEIRAIEKKMTKGSCVPIPIIALTGYSSGEYNHKTLLVGMNDFVTKPYNIIQVISKIQEWALRSTQEAHLKTSIPSPSVELSQSSSSFFSSSGYSAASASSSSSSCSSSTSTSLVVYVPKIS